jgi:hypothetical protein
MKMPNQGNPLLDYFVSNNERAIHKWIDYFDVYHRFFQSYRGLSINFCEIGVQNGGSTQMWKNYFGDQAKIIGVDIDNNCKLLEKEGVEIWIGDQADPAFWQGFKQKHLNLDIVLDDGGHTMQQQITTFVELFPILNDGGLFLCEDTHTSYFPRYGGGKGKPDTFHEFVKNLMDEMHAWYHAPLSKMAEQYFAQHIYSISIFDSIIVIEKKTQKSSSMFLSWL